MYNGSRNQNQFQPPRNQNTFGAVNTGRVNIPRTPNANSFGSNSFGSRPNTAPKANLSPMNNIGMNVTKQFNTAVNNASKVANSVGTTVTNAANSVGTTMTNAANSVGNAVGGSWALPLGIFVVLVGVFVTLFSLFTKEIIAGYENIITSIRAAMGTKPVPAPAPVPEPVVAPVPEMPHMTANPMSGSAGPSSMVEKILPPTHTPPEVFSVSKNDYTYYDAEPLCRALGAELATYDQVKSAYDKGADWCNYGWVKGQMAVFPTQKGTYDKLQMGPDDERGACGKPGLNGGYFDNPEMKFGVTCYGSKPEQSAHDEAELAKNGKIPRTVNELKIDQKVQQFQKDADSVGILPFNVGKWSA